MPEPFLPIFGKENTWMRRWSKQERWRENEIKWDVEYEVQQEREARACEGVLVWTESCFTGALGNRCPSRLGQLTPNPPPRGDLGQCCSKLDLPLEARVVWPLASSWPSLNFRFIRYKLLMSLGCREGCGRKFTWRPYHGAWHVACSVTMNSFIWQVLQYWWASHCA